jgi:hypothetical protein
LGSNICFHRPPQPEGVGLKYEMPLKRHSGFKVNDGRIALVEADIKRKGGFSRLSFLSPMIHHRA